MKYYFKNAKDKEVIFVVTPVIIANNFIYRAIDEHRDMTPLKLQKLIYFLYKEYLQKTGKELFGERFETWKHGPVLPSVYYEFSSFGRNPITKFARDSQNNVKIVTEEGVFKNTIDLVWSRYKGFSGEELSEKTHTVGSAWSIARDNKFTYLRTEDIKNEQVL